MAYRSQIGFECLQRLDAFVCRRCCVKCVNVESFSSRLRQAAVGNRVFPGFQQLRHFAQRVLTLLLPTAKPKFPKNKTPWHAACLDACLVTQEAVSTIRTDAELIEACRQGHQDSWSELIRRYKQLIYSVIRTYDVPPQDGLDIFQAVCLDLFSGLAQLRESKAISKWIITITSHHCMRWKNQYRRDPVSQGDPMVEVGSQVDTCRLEQEQIVRRALDQLSRRCRVMIHMLFFRHPPLPYMELAPRMGVAVGSIGFIRGRCLKRLRAELELLGF